MKRIIYGMSFSELEVKFLAYVMTTLLRGGDLQVAVRNPAFNGIARKVAHAVERIAEKNQKEE
jgi:hypothetical protein